MADLLEDELDLKVQGMLEEVQELEVVLKEQLPSVYEETEKADFDPKECDLSLETFSILQQHLILRLHSAIRLIDENKRRKSCRSAANDTDALATELRQESNDSGKADGPSLVVEVDLQDGSIKDQDGVFATKIISVIECLVRLQGVISSHSSMIAEAKKKTTSKIRNRSPSQHTGCPSSRAIPSRETLRRNNYRRPWAEPPLIPKYTSHNFDKPTTIPTYYTPRPTSRLAMAKRPPCSHSYSELDKSGRCPVCCNCNKSHLDIPEDVTKHQTDFKNMRRPATPAAANQRNVYPVSSSSSQSSATDSLCSQEDFTFTIRQLRCPSGPSPFGEEEFSWQKRNFDLSNATKIELSRLIAEKDKEISKLVALITEHHPKVRLSNTDLATNVESNMSLGSLDFKVGDAFKLKPGNDIDPEDTQQSRNGERTGTGQDLQVVSHPSSDLIDLDAEVPSFLVSGPAASPDSKTNDLLSDMQEKNMSHVISTLQNIYEEIRHISKIVTTQFEQANGQKSNNNPENKSMVTVGTSTSCTLFSGNSPTKTILGKQTLANKSKPTPSCMNFRTNSLPTIKSRTNPNLISRKENQIPSLAQTRSSNSTTASNTKIKIPGVTIKPPILPPKASTTGRSKLSLEAKSSNSKRPSRSSSKVSAGGRSEQSLIWPPFKLTDEMMFPDVERALSDARAMLAMSVKEEFGDDDKQMKDDKGLTTTTNDPGEVKPVRSRSKSADKSIEVEDSKSTDGKLKSKKKSKSKLTHKTQEMSRVNESKEMADKGAIISEAKVDVDGEGASIASLAPCVNETEKVADWLDQFKFSWTGSRPPSTKKES